jgi:hypothetical protein
LSFKICKFKCLTGLKNIHLIKPHLYKGARRKRNKKLLNTLQRRDAKAKQKTSKSSTKARGESETKTSKSSTKARGKSETKKEPKILCKGAAKRNKFKTLYKGEGESDKKRRNPLQNSLGQMLNKRILYKDSGRKRNKKLHIRLQRPSQKQN